MTLSPKKVPLQESTASLPDRELPLYLKEIGQVLLLDRAGEVTLCKKIEEADEQMLEALFVLPMTLEFLKDQRLRLGHGEILAKHVVQKDKEMAVDVDGELDQAEIQDPQEDDEDFRKRVIQQLGDLCQCIEFLIDSPVEKSNSCGKGSPKTKHAVARKRFLKMVKSLNWHSKFFHQIESRIQSLEIQLKEVLHRLGVSQEVIRQIGIQKTSLNIQAFFVKNLGSDQKDLLAPPDQKETLEHLKYIETHLSLMPFKDFLFRVQQLEQAKARVHFC